jgi:hypothetical protein
MSTGIFGLDDVASSTVLNELRAAADSMKDMRSHILVTSPRVSLLDLLEKFPGMFSRDDSGWLRERAANLPLLTQRPLVAKRYLVKKDIVPDDPTIRSLSDSERPWSLLHSEGTFEKQQSLLGPGEVILSPLMLVWSILAYHHKTQEWLPAVQNHFLRTAAIIGGTLDRLCIGLNDERTKIRLLPFQDQFSDANYQLAAGIVWRVA